MDSYDEHFTACSSWLCQSLEATARTLLPVRTSDGEEACDAVWQEDAWSEERQRAAEAAERRKGGARMPPFWRDAHERHAARNWDRFYRRNGDAFYKDRHYLARAFPEVRETPADVALAAALSGAAATAAAAAAAPAAAAAADAAAALNGAAASVAFTSGAVTQIPLAPPPDAAAVPKQSQEALPPAPPPLPPPRRGRRALLELGCGVGNAVFPLLQQNRGLYVYALDLAPSAIALLRARRDGGGGSDAAGGGDFAERCYAEVHDAAAADALPCAVTAEGGVDMVMLMFALSAVAPEKHARVMAKAAAALRPGGVVLFRDYGRYDEAQLRLPVHARIADNFYARADGTRAYYFDLPDVAALAAAAGLDVLELEAVRRRCANRKTSAVFNRVWVHAKLRRPAAAAV